MFSQARQINGCKDIVGEWARGTKGTTDCASLIEPLSGDQWRFKQKKPVNAYEQEHQNLIASIREGKPINEAQNIAESTLTAILGREATYSGHEVTWDQAMQSETKLGPEKVEFGSFAVPAIARPGTYKFSWSPGVHGVCSQSTTCSPLTRANSPVLFVTSVRS
jgi:hypothetical protein